ncbi:MAG: glycoside hydrolase family 97 catalytic domain-containing protein, partial [Acidobacteriota bacterium]
MKKMLSNLPLWLPLVLVATVGGVSGQSRYTLKSPDGRIEVGVMAGEKLVFSVTVDGQPVLKESPISMRIDGRELGLDSKVESTSEDSVDRQLAPVVRRKAAQIREHYNQLRLAMVGGWAVTFRAYDEGVAYRFETSLAAPEVTVNGEESDLTFAGDFSVYYPKEESFFSHNEREFVQLKLSEIDAKTIASLPAVVEAGNVKVAIADSDIEEYPGMWLRGDSSDRLVTICPPYPLEEKLDSDRNFQVTKAADYIAKTRGTRTYPWRILGIAAHDGDLITNSMVWLLDSPSKVEDTSWIHPGKVAWDWYNANNLFNVDFKAGINTETYKYYIDFASKYGLEYVILDEGWYKLGDLLSVVPSIDIEELVQYGRQKHVGIILWAVWKTLDDQFDTAMPQFEKWGVQGIKVDFMQRDDQKMIDFYHRLCRDAAKRHMLVDFHGGIRAATMTRAWPNLISTEGVRGLEQYKWS